LERRSLEIRIRCGLPSPSWRWARRIVQWMEAQPRHNTVPIPAEGLLIIGGSVEYVDFKVAGTGVTEFCANDIRDGVSIEVT
jgi:hypothetical protein